MKFISFKVTSIILIIIMLMNMNPFDFHSFETKGASPPPDDGINGFQIIDGDWTVTSEQNYTDEVIELNGNLFIRGGGTLRFKNVTLRMNVTSSSPQYFINIDEGGKFYILDGDGNYKTTGDASNITDSIYDYDNKLDNSSDYRYYIMNFGGLIWIENSNMRESGSSSSRTISGLYVQDGFAVIKNSTISNFYRTAYFANKQQNDKPNLLIENSTVHDCYYGISLDYSYYNLIKYCNFFNIKYYAIDIYDSYYNTIVHSDFYNCSRAGYDYTMYIDYSHYTEISNCTIEYAHGGLDFYYSSNIWVQNCQFTNFNIEGIYMDSAYRDNFHFNFNHFENMNYECLYLTRADYVHIIGNTYNNTTNDVMYITYITYSLIEYNTATNFTNRGLYLRDSNYNEVKNNTIYCGLSTNAALFFNDCDYLTVKDNSIAKANYGFYFEYCYYDIKIKNNILQGRGITSNSPGIEFYYTDDIYMENNAIKGFNIGIRGYHSTYNKPDNPVKMYYDSISSCPTDFYLEEKSNFNIYNGSFSFSKLYFSSSGNPTLNVYWPVNVHVYDTKGAVGGALVTVSNATKDVAEKYTNERGWAYNLFILNGSYTFKSNKYATPYNFSANISGSIAYAPAEYIVDKWKDIYIYFNENTIPSPPFNLRFEVNYTNVDLLWDCYVSDLASYKVYQNDSSDGWIEIAHVKNPPSGVPQKYVDIGNATKLVEFTYKIQHIDSGFQEGVNDINVTFNDWVVVDKKLVEDRTVTINGSLYVEFGGELELSNVDLTMNGTGPNPEPEIIEIRYGGTLILSDGDGDPKTTNDMTIIQASETLKTYEFYIRENGTLETYNSWIENCSTPGGPWSTCSISVEKGYLDFYNTTIITSTIGIFMDFCNGSTIYGSSFDNDGKNRYTTGIFAQYSSNITIENSTFNSSWSGEINFYESFYIDIINNTINSNNETGLQFTSIRILNIYGNKIKNTDNEAMQIYDSDSITIDSNEIWQFDSLGIDIDSCTHIQILNNSIHDGPDATGGILMEKCSDITIGLNNIDTVGSSWSFGMFFEDYYDLTIAYNTITNTPFGMYLNGDEDIEQGSVYIYNNTVFNSSLEDMNFGIALGACLNTYVFNNTVYEFYYGIAMDSNKNTYLGNNTVFNCTYAFGQYGGEGQLYYGNVVWGSQYGFWFQWGALATILNCSILDIPPYTVYVNESSEVVLINPSFNLTNIYVSDKTCKVEIRWAFDLLVRDQFGIPQKDIFVRIRNIYGTIIEEKYTDPSGMIYYITVVNRVQYYDNNLTFTPHTFEAKLGNHEGTLKIAVQSSGTIQMQLGNEAPSAYNVLINPLAPKTKDDLDLQYVYSDPEDDANSGTVIKWYRNGIHQPSLDGQTTVNSQFTTKGDLWYCIVKPSDGADYGINSTSMTAVIYNTKPTVDNIVIKPEEPDSIEDLIVEYTFLDDDEDEELGTLYKWYMDEGSGFVLKETTNEPILNHSKTKKGETWKVIIVPKDGEASGDDFESAPITIGNTIPTIENARITPEKPTSSDKISVFYDFIDVDGDLEEGTTFQWYYVPVGGLNYIKTEFTLKEVEASYLLKGQKWMCEIKPNDGQPINLAPTYNTSEVVIENTAPVISDLQVLPGNPETTDELSVTYNFSDVDGDPENDTLYEWLMRSGGIYLRTGLKVQNLPTLFTTKGEEWICEVIPFDGFTYGKPYLSKKVTIGNSAPTASELSCIPEEPRTTDTLTAVYEYHDENSDLESGTIIKWYMNDKHHTDLDNSLTVDSKYTQKGEVWYFTVTPSDGAVSGETSYSAEITIRNSKPKVQDPRITNLFPRGDEDLEVTYDYYDPDGDLNVNTEIKWYKDGELQDQLDDLLIIPSNLTEKGQSWYYQIWVYDGFEKSDSNESFPVIIRNAPPVLISYKLNQSVINIDENESLEFSVDVEDPDGDYIFYQWNLIDKETGEPESVGEGEKITFITTFEDAGNYTLNVTIQDWDVNPYKIYHEWAVIIKNINRLPKISVIEPEGESLKIKEGNTVKFSISVTDEDKEDELQISWYFDTGITPVSTTNTYETDDDISARTHTIEVRVYDGYDTVSKIWNLTVKPKDEGQELIYGRTWDQWSVLLQVLVIIFTVIFGAIGFWKLKKKKGALHEYTKQIEEPMKNWQEDPDGSEEELIKIAEVVEKDFKDGKIEDLQYFLLNRQIKENLREIRQERVESAFSYLPPQIHKELEIMLDDGKLTENEYQTFLGILAQAPGITPEQKDEIKRQLQRWRDLDKKRSEKKIKIMEDQEADEKMLRNKMR